MVEGCAVALCVCRCGRGWREQKEDTKINARQGKGKTFSLCQASRAFLFCIFSLLRYCLFVADGFDRVEAGGFLCGIPAEEYARERTDGETHDDGPRLNGDGPVGQ